MRRTIVHVITALGPGGAEEVLTRLASRQRSSKYEHIVVSLRGGDTDLQDELRSAGVRVISLDARPGSMDPRIVLRLAGVLRREHPAAVQTWMYHADLAGGLAAKLAGSPPVAWNIRNGTLAPAFSKRMTLAIVRMNALLSRWLPAVIVCCAESAKQIHVEQGFPSRRMIVIPNGYDLERFRPDPAARARIWAESGIPGNARVMGLVARYHPQKDHAAFFQAAQRVAQRFDDVHFLLCGDDVTSDDPELRLMVERAGIKDRCHLLGHRTDVAAVQASIDIACLCSKGGEGFPNAIAEAMACGALCVVTDVGDAALIVSDAGRIVPIGDPEAFASAVGDILEMPDNERLRIGQRARQRIVERFDISQFMERYEALYDQLAGADQAGDLAFATSD